MLKVAKKELEDWYKTHEEQIAKTKAANRYFKYCFNLHFNGTQKYSVIFREPVNCISYLIVYYLYILEDTFLPNLSEIISALLYYLCITVNLSLKYYIIYL